MEMLLEKYSFTPECRHLSQKWWMKNVLSFWCKARLF